MFFKDHLKKLLTGLMMPQEYICVGLNAFPSPMSVFAEVEDQKFLLDVTASHLFLGYKPLIIGLPFKMGNRDFESLKGQHQVTLKFQNGTHSVAELSLIKIGETGLEKEVVLFYEGKYGVHSFLNPIHQWINLQRERWRQHVPNNINLPGNLFEQVHIAYSVPRIISIITVSDGTLMNMFPTDLHGPVGEKFYVGSLRKGGLANEQVEKYNRIVISEVEVSFYKQAYSLGKNHMKQLTKENGFLLHTEKSKVFGFPLPKDVIRYRELKRVDFLDRGIHRIHLYEVIHEQTSAEGRSTLAHIHSYYAQWRNDQALTTNYLFR